MKIKREYIGIAFNEARILKWKDGVDEHRGGDPSLPFAGEPCEEAYQESLDQVNIMETIEERFNVDLTAEKDVAEWLGRRYQEIHKTHQL